MSTPQLQTTPEQNKALITRWFTEVWNERRRDTIAELYGEDCVFREGSAVHHGRASFYAFHDALRGHFSDVVVTPMIALAERDLACLRWSVEFTVTQTGKRLTATGTTIARIRNGQFVEAWQNWDASVVAAEIPGFVSPPPA